MERFWNARAREDAFYFVDNRQAYRKPEAEAFWARGEEELDLLLGVLGVCVAPQDVVVDVGCGVGRLTRVLAARAREVWALDVSEGLRRDARARPRPINRGLGNVRWTHGDGTFLTGIPDAFADACVSHVVFQHLPDPVIALGYVREMGRVLRPGGWAAFQVSNDPALHSPTPGRRLRSLVRRAPRGQADPSWVGSAVDLDDLRAAAADGGLVVERIEGAGTQFCLVLARRSAPA